ncbi:hypothetical protein FI667_g1907, partial [Globisporangium splendens]
MLAADITIQREIDHVYSTNVMLMGSLQSTERVAERFPDRKEAKAVVSLLRFVLCSSAKYNVSYTELVLELQQLGLEKSLVDIVAQVYERNVVNLREQLKCESFKSMAPAQKIELTIDLDQVVHTSSGALDAKCDGNRRFDTKNGSKLEFKMDREKFFSLYEELLHAQALLQRIQL